MKAAVRAESSLSAVKFYPEKYSCIHVNSDLILLVYDAISSFCILGRKKSRVVKWWTLVHKERLTD